MRLALLLVVLPLAAQPKMDRFYATGATFQTYSHPELTGWAAVGVPLDAARLNWSFTEYDVSPSKGPPYSVQTTVMTGFATQIRQLGQLRLFALVDGGYATVNNNAGGAAAGSFVATFPIRKSGWAVLGAYRILKTSVAPGSPKAAQLGLGRTF